LAELCAQHPGRFAGYVGALPMNAPEQAAREAERILIAGNANGLQLHTNVNGACLDEPRFFPIFELAAQSGKPILLHPARTPNFPIFPRRKTRNTRSGRYWAGPMRPAPRSRGSSFPG
jgi:predicted TIM-barrel fold metal-dependent hydrolase